MVFNFENISDETIIKYSSRPTFYVDANGNEYITRFGLAFYRTNNANEYEYMTNTTQANIDKNQKYRIDINTEVLPQYIKFSNRIYQIGSVTGYIDTSLTYEIILSTTITSFNFSRINQINNLKIKINVLDNIYYKYTRIYKDLKYFGISDEKIEIVHNEYIVEKIDNDSDWFITTVKLKRSFTHCDYFKSRFYYSGSGFPSGTSMNDMDKYYVIFANIKPDTLIIESNKFFNYNILYQITIPNSVTSIQDNAFDSCTSLTSITIPNRVTYIGKYAFYFCSSLTSLTIRYNTSIGPSLLSKCTSLTTINISVPNKNTLLDDSIPIYSQYKFSSPSKTFNLIYDVVATTLTSSSLKISGLTPGQKYYISLKAFNSYAGFTAPSNAITGYIPSQLSEYKDKYYGVDNSGLTHYYPFDVDYLNYAYMNVNGVKTATGDAYATQDVDISNNATKLTKGAIYLASNANTKYVKLPDKTFTNNSGLSFATWLKLGGTGKRRIFDVSFNNNNFISILLNDASLNLSLDSSYNSTRTLTNSTYYAKTTLTEWHHYAVTISRKNTNTYTVKFYVDGSNVSPVSSDISLNDTSSNATIYIGSLTDSSNGLKDAYVNQSLVFNRVLTDEEVSYLGRGLPFAKAPRISIAPYNIDFSGSITKLFFTIGSPPTIASIDPSGSNLIVKFTDASAGFPAPAEYYYYYKKDYTYYDISKSEITLANGQYNFTIKNKTTYEISNLYLKRRNVAGDTSYSNYQNYAINDASVVAIIQLKTQDMRNTFKIRLGSKTEIGNFDNNGYYVYDYSFVMQQPTPINSMMDASGARGAIKTVTSGMVDKHDRTNLIPNDFINYLALKLLEISPSSTIIPFANTTELITDIRDKGVYSSSGELYKNIKNNLIDASYLTDVTTSNVNLCREIFRQMYFQDPSRFDAFTEGQITSLPFYNGDSINFNLTIAPLGNITPSRTYEICMEMVSDPSNTLIT